MAEILKVLIGLKGFWALVFQLILAIVFYFLPDFPKSIWLAFEALFVFVTGVIVAQTTIKEVRKTKGG